MKNSLQNLDVQTHFQCFFIEDLIKEGTFAVSDWFCLRKDNPKDPERRPNDYNGWSQVAKRLSGVINDEIKKNQASKAMGYAKVTCSIYEEILPTMKEEFDKAQIGQIGFMMTQIESLKIYINLLNHFGPQTDPYELSAHSIESLLSKTIRDNCSKQPQTSTIPLSTNLHTIASQIEQQTSKPNDHTRLLVQHINANDFQAELRCICAKNTLTQLLEQLKEEHLSPEIQKWLDYLKLQ